MGRKEARTFLKQFSLVTAYTGGDDVREAEANTKRSITHHGRAYTDIRVQGEILEGLSGSESMARRKRNVKNLGDPYVS